VALTFPATGVVGQAIFRPVICNFADYPTANLTNYFNATVATALDTPYVVSFWADAHAPADWIAGQYTGGTTLNPFASTSAQVYFHRHDAAYDDYLQVNVSQASKTNRVLQYWYGPDGFPTPDALHHYLLYVNYPTPQIWVDGVEVTSWSYDSGAITGLRASTQMRFGGLSGNGLDTTSDEFAVWKTVSDITNVMTLDELAVALAAGYTWNGSAWV